MFKVKYDLGDGGKEMVEEKGLYQVIHWGGGGVSNNSGVPNARMGCHQ